MPPAKARRVVAELGRPETPEEEAARRAENSRLYRERKTVNNLIYSMLATLGVVAIIFFAVPRSDEAPAWQVDYVAAAQAAQANVSSAIVVPVLDATWQANAAEVRTSADDITEWRIGFITPMQGYIGFEQAFGAGSSWLSTRMEKTTPVSTVVIDGITWDVYDNGPAGNNSSALATKIGDTTYLLRGDADTSEFALLASAVTAAINVSTAQ
jgi:hypothetical protein